MVATRLRVVSRRSNLDRSVVEVNPIHYPREFGARRVYGGKKHQRTLKHGEIKRFVQMSLEVFFTEVLPVHERHEPLDLYDITHVLAPEVSAWVSKMSGNADYRLVPYQVAQALRTMDIKGIKFRIEGRVVMLPTSSNDNLRTRVKLQRR